MKPLAPWSERPPEEARLFNPAFAALLLARATNGYQSEKACWLPVGLSYLVLPAILPRGTRSLLPHKSTTSLVAWVSDNQDEVAIVARRASEAAPLTREALIFGVAHASLAITKDGLSPGVKPFPKQPTLGSDEADECVRKALTFGKWLAIGGTPSTVMSLFGVRP
jgi:hypothetical protein